MPEIRHCLLPAALALLACDSPEPTALDVAPSFSAGQRVVGHVNGEGVVNVGVPMSFEMTALLLIVAATGAIALAFFRDDEEQGT